MKILLGVMVGAIFGMYSMQPRLKFDNNNNLVNYDQGIFKALENHDEAAVFAMLHHGVSLNVRTGVEGSTLMHKAADLGQVSVVKKLIECGAPLNLALHGGTGARPLHNAVRGGHFFIAQQLIEAGVSPNSFSCYDNCYPLSFAFSNNDFLTVDLLVGAGAIITSQESKQCYSTSPLLDKVCLVSNPYNRDLNYHKLGGRNYLSGLTALECVKALIFFLSRDYLPDRRYSYPLMPQKAGFPSKACIFDDLINELVRKNEDILAPLLYALKFAVIRGKKNTIKQILDALACRGINYKNHLHHILAYCIRHYKYELSEMILRAGACTDCAENLIQNLPRAVALKFANIITREKIARLIMNPAQSSRLSILPRDLRYNYIGPMCEFVQHTGK